LPPRTATTVALPAIALFLCAVLSWATPSRAASDQPAEMPFAGIDRRALAAPPSETVSVERLVSYLTNGAKSDTEKARAIFRWITANIAFDASAMRTTNPLKVDVERILREKRTVCMGYSEIFYILGRAAGLEVERIQGFAKGYPGDDNACDGAPCHEWNAVKLDGSWALLDCTWAAGRFENGGTFVKQYDEFYFLTPPERFVLDHFPLDPDWQLLPKAVSCAEYASLAHLRSAFFKYGLELDSHRYFSISTTEPITITIRAPKDILILAQLTRDGEEVTRGYTFGERKGDRFAVTAAFPCPGNYRLRLFAGREDSSDRCDWVAEYAIAVPSLSKPAHRFPECHKAYLRRDAVVISPRCGHLEPGSRERFSVCVPGAKIVAVIAGEKWSYLERNGDVFEGAVHVTGEPMQVCANFGNPREYQVLLTYNQPQVGVAGSQQETGTPPKP